jgi:Tol biopolymer transport system component
VIGKLVYRFNGAGYLKPDFTHLFVVPADGGTERQISSGNFPHGGAANTASEAVWTPDGKYLIMSANRREDYETDRMNTEIYEFSVADGAVKALTNRIGPDDNPDISPDGTAAA